MKQILVRIKLVEYLNSEIEVDIYKFVDKFRENVEECELGMMSDSIDFFSSNKNEYRGHVDYQGFKIKRRRRLFDSTMSLSIAKGTFEQKETILNIKAEINGFSGMMIPFYIVGIIIYGAFFIALLTGVEFNGNESGFALPFILLHAIFMLGLPYFMMRRSVKRMKYDLEREFYYLTK